MLLGFWIGFKCGNEYSNKKTNKELIERKLKHYDQQTGELVWKGEKL